MLDYASRANPAYIFFQHHHSNIFATWRQGNRMKYVIDADNIKCGGCASAIQDALGGLDGVQAVDVDIDSGRVTVTADEGLRNVLAATLQASGYPEK